MGTVVEDISTTKKRLQIQIPAEVIENEYKGAIAKLKQQAKVPGFRPGKTPESLIERRFGEDIKADIIDRLVPRSYSEALKEASLVPVTLPDFEGGPLELKRSEPLAFTVTVEVRPEVSGLKYDGMETDQVDVQVEDKEIAETLSGLQEEKAVYEAVDREIRSDDLIVIDYVKRDPTGEKELSSGRDQVMNLGNNLAPAGILDELLGKKKGDVVTIRLPNTAGGEEDQTTDGGDMLEITVKDVKEKHLPSLDDEFAKDLGVESLAALSDRIKEGIMKAKRDKADNEQKGKLLAKLVASYDFEVPESLLEKELETLMVNERLSKDQSRKTGPDQSEPVDAAEDLMLREKVMPKAIENVKAEILLDIIAEREQISATEAELKTRIAALARQFQTTPENVINLFMTKDGSLDKLMRTIRDEKTLGAILAKADSRQGASAT